jgi:hypothetical protein
MYHSAHAHHPAHTTRPSAIVTASSVFGPTLGELPDSVARRMALPEHVATVQVGDGVMFHWPKHGQHSNDFRADTGTYQWVANAARAALSNPYALKRDKEPCTFHLIGKVEPLNQYPTVGYFRLVLKYVPARRAGSGKPEILFVTWLAHSEGEIKRYLNGAEIMGT